MMLKSLNKDRPFPKTKVILKDCYDYIIVGGGTAGSVMANRLSENKCVTVLLLEAGGDAPVLTDLPAAGRLFYRSYIDWQYKIEPQKHCGFGQKGNSVLWNSGKALGGGSVLNAMLYVRGCEEIYNQWEAEGATGWSYDDCFPYFLKLEDNQNLAELDPGYHRRGGPMTAEKPNYESEIKEPILKATAAMGFRKTDINGVNATGIYDLQATMRHQQRCSTAKAYLVPAEDRPNLDIVKNAFVTKIVIVNKRAVGVEVYYLLKNRTVCARKEVIVSCGTVRTPQLLMLSGIGPKEELEKFNIPKVAYLPVGRNLQDHYASSLVYQLSHKITPIVLKSLAPTSILDYILNRHGPLCSADQVSVMGFVDGYNTSALCPKQQCYFCDYAVSDAERNFNCKPEVFKKYYGPYFLKPLYICFASLLQPKSRGIVTLKSTNPFDQPLIDPRYYEDERDLDDVVKAMKFCQAVAKHPALKKIKAKPLDTVFPGCEKCKNNEHAYHRCMARHLVHTFWHPVGTARMGNVTDPRSVVDPKLRVIGVKGLRVVNAAVMPIIPAGNTNVPTMMVAEKAYDMMKDDIKCYCRKKVSKKRRNRRCLRCLRPSQPRRHNKEY